MLGGTLSLLYLTGSKISLKFSFLSTWLCCTSLVPLHFCSPPRLLLWDLALRVASVTFIHDTTEKMVKDKFYSATQSSAVSPTPLCPIKYLCPTRRKKCSSKFLATRMCALCCCPVHGYERCRRMGGIHQNRQLCSASPCHPAVR